MDNTTRDILVAFIFDFCCPGWGFLCLSGLYRGFGPMSTGFSPCRGDFVGFHDSPQRQIENFVVFDVNFRCTHSSTAQRQTPAQEKRAGAWEVFQKAIGRARNGTMWRNHPVTVGGDSILPRSITQQGRKGWANSYHVGHGSIHRNTQKPLPGGRLIASPTRAGQLSLRYSITSSPSL